MTGNAVHAVLHTQAAPIAAAVAVVPPLALLTAVHGVTALQHSHARTTATHLLAILMTVLIAAAAFWLSFTALRSLAELGGIPHNQAWLWPLIIEGSMTQATVALISLTHQRPTTANTAPPNADTAPHTTKQPDVPTYASKHPRPGAEIHATGTSQWSDLATLICGRDPARRRDPEQVEQILRMYYDDGLNPTEIARRTRRSRSTISSEVPPPSRRADYLVPARTR
ncbi:DUF2637 domain-containing protein [Nocardia wallacei]|uniref:DUF2637 domain-containing protein n=1 Tax=Nocardia wallacei TaxID=480035 RepID=UPI00245617D0|nr:DUF2637 domain-containing protein [Nocardia wallacei]